MRDISFIFHILKGIIPQLTADLFKTRKDLGYSVKDVAISMAYFEIYNEKLFDLLIDSKNQTKEQDLVIKENAGTIIVENLTWIPITDFTQFSNYYAKAVKQRRVGETKLNRLSSRSHAILTIKIERKEGDRKYISKIHLIDLAGSEDNRYVCMYYSQ